MRSPRPHPPSGERGRGSVVWVPRVWVDTVLYPQLLKHSPSPVSSLSSQLASPEAQDASSPATVHSCHCLGLPCALPSVQNSLNFREPLPWASLSKPPLYLIRLLSFAYLVLKFIKFSFTWKCSVFSLCFPLATPHHIFLLREAVLNPLPHRVISVIHTASRQIWARQPLSSAHPGFQCGSFWNQVLL